MTENFVQNSHGGLTVQPATGPDYAPAAKPGVGFDSERCLRYALAPGFAGLAGQTVRELRHLVAEGDELSYFLFPAYCSEDKSETDASAWHVSGYAATGVAIDLLFADGGRLSEEYPLDQHGFALTAEGQSRSLSVDQWNRKAVSLVPFVGRTVVAIELVLAGHGSDGEAQGWLDSVSIGPGCVNQGRRPSDWVITTRGTHSSRRFSRGNTLPATAVPGGFNFLTPVSDASDPDWPYSYHQHNDERNRPVLQAFAISHSPTPWIGDHGVLHLFPSGADGVPEAGRRARQLTFRHGREHAAPHRYAVVFDSGIGAELASTEHAAIATFTFPDENASILLDQVTDEGCLDLSAVDGTRPVARGYTDYQGSLVDGSTRMFFSIEFDRPALEYGLLAVDERERTAGYLRFDVGDRGSVTARIATSFISIEQAERSLRQEIAPDDTVATVSARAQDLWDELLGAFSVIGATSDQLTTFYSSLYRLFLYPNVAHENVGTVEEPRFRYASVFRSARGAHSATETAAPIESGTLTVNNGFWDTYRTAWPAYALFAPERAARLLDGFVRHYLDGGWMARWSAPGYVDCMVGTSSDIVFADAVVKGVPLSDPETAYDSALKNATVPSADPAVGRKGLESGIFRGYISTNIHEGMSWSLENAINDFGLFVFSQWLLDYLGPDHERAGELAANMQYFRSRAMGYALLHDPATGFFQGRDGTGAFRHAAAEYDPCVWGGDYTETNGWGMAFTVPHDGEGLATLLGGRDALEVKLDRFFATPELGRAETQGSYGTIIHEMTEARDVRMGMLGLSNQPAHHIPYMYAFTRSRHKTQALTREALRRLFLGSEIGQGYPGDEDNGEMSAWYLFSALGFYPLTVGSPSYAITAPLFERVSVRLGEGRELVVETIGNAPDHVYIQRMFVDGRPWDSPFISHEVLVGGCRIVAELGPEPSTWGSDESAQASLSESGARPAPLVDLLGAEVTATFAGVERLVDDSSATHASVPAGGEVVWVSPQEQMVETYTVTAGPSIRQSASRWRLEGSIDGEMWQLLDERDGERFQWPRQTRPFLVAAREPYRYHRIVFLDEDTREVSQLELLAAAGGCPGVPFGAEAVPPPQ